MNFPLREFLFPCLKTCDSYYRARVGRDTRLKDLLRRSILLLKGTEGRAIDLHPLVESNLSHSR